MRIMKDHDNVMSAPVIDREVIDELYDLLEDEAHEVIQGFIDEGIQQAQGLRGILTSHTHLCRLAQRLKNTAAHLGAARLVTACRRLEKAAVQPEVAGREEMVGSIEAELATAVTALQDMTPADRAP